MSIHHTECAAMTNLPPSKKLVFMSICDSADKDTGLGFPGFDTMQRWSGLGRSQVHTNLQLLIADGWIARVSSGHNGRRAVFRVFDQRACCVVHRPLGKSGPPDPTSVDNPETEVRPTGPYETVGSGKGSGKGSGLDRTPTQFRSSKRTTAAAREGFIAVENLPDEIQALWRSILEIDAFAYLAFNRLDCDDVAEIVDLVKRHGVPELVRAAKSTRSGGEWDIKAFRAVWRSLAARPTVNRDTGPRCQVCHHTEPNCRRAAMQVASGERHIFAPERLALVPEITEEN